MVTQNYLSTSGVYKIYRCIDFFCLSVNDTITPTALILSSFLISLLLFLSDCSPDDMAALAAENAALKQTLAEKDEEIRDLHQQLSGKENELKRHRTALQNEKILSVELIQAKEEKTPKLFSFYTGLTYERFTALVVFLIPTGRMQYSENRQDLIELSNEDGLLLTLCRMRQKFALKDIATRFGLTIQSASIAFNSWLDLLYLKLSQISIWPLRETIIENMPAKYKKEFPTCLALIDGTEIKTETPSAMKLQSQLYSDYKSSTTLKALVACDPRGSLLFTSELFTGSISDKAITSESGFLELLKSLKDVGYIQEGDAIMADKGFLIKNEVEELGLVLNIPPFASSTTQMTPEDIATTQRIARHRVHVERMICRIKKFRLVAGTVPLSLFPAINKLWSVACLLTLFQDTLVKDKDSE